MRGFAKEINAAAPHPDQKSQDEHDSGPAEEELMLQQHRALLSRDTACRVTHRAIETVLTVLTLINLTNVQALPYAPFACAWASAIVALIWQSEKQLLARRVAAIERVLAKKSGIAFEEIYVTYRFQSSSLGPMSAILRLEPL